MTYDVKLTILLMGRSCSSCKQNFEASVTAQSSEEAVAICKALSGADPEAHKFLVNYVRQR